MPTDSDHSATLPELVIQWVHTNPFPILILGADNETLTANESLSELLHQVRMEQDDLLREMLATGEHTLVRGEEMLETLDEGQCVVKRISLTGSHHYVSHIVKLAIDDSPCLCCILMPDTDPSQRYLMGVLNTITTLVVEFDSLGNIRYINDQLLSHLGYGRADHRSLRHMQHLEPDFTQEVNHARTEEVRRRGVCRFRTRFVSADGSPVAMDASLVKNQTPGESTYLLTARDITLQLTHEKTLRDALDRSTKDGLDLQRENTRLRGEVERIQRNMPLVYESRAFAEVVNRIRQIAPTDVPVLITGEAGTGKRLIARTIHRLSRREQQSFEMIECGTLPPELIESELFGYEPGVFTGAYRDRVGRLDVADGGTLCLYQVDALPLHLQSRLLRVIQEGQFKPTGESTYRPTNVRLLAVTDQDLESLVEQGKFRADLRYRFQAYRIDSIPLRERKEDIPPLVEYFTREFSSKYGKEMTGPDITTIERLLAYDFPGNVSELKQIIERAFIISEDRELRFALPAEDRTGSRPVLNLFDGRITEFLSFEEYQRKYIQLVLESTGGKVSGKNGAAEILKMHPQTLFSRMKRLGIRR